MNKMMGSWIWCYTAASSLKGVFSTLHFFTSFHRCSTGWTSEVMEGVLGCCSGVLWVIDLRPRLSLLSLGSMLRSKVCLASLKTSLIQGPWCQTKQSDPTEPPPWLTVRCVNFFESFIFLSVNTELMRLAKKFQFCLISPEGILPKVFVTSQFGFDQIPVGFFVFFF